MSHGKSASESDAGKRGGGCRRPIGLVSLRRPLLLPSFSCWRVLFSCKVRSGVRGDGIAGRHQVSCLVVLLGPGDGGVGPCPIGRVSHPAKVQLLSMGMCHPSRDGIEQERRGPLNAVFVLAETCVCVRILS
jgi:hypothetical protein